MSESERVFSEQEVTALMKRAVELQEANKHPQKEYRPGVTRDELVRAAREIGVDPSFLEQAIREKLQGKAASGSPLFQEEQRVVDGEIDPNDFDLVLQALSPVSSRRHPVAQVGRTLSARAMTGSGIAKVEVTSRGGRTRINVKPFPALEIIGTFYPAFIISMVAAAPLTESGQPLLGAGVAAAAFAAAALVCRSWLGRSRSAAARLADRIQGVVSDHLREEGDVRSRVENAKSQPPEETQEIEGRG